MKRKGISPLIAAVLMIAFTMAIASLFSGWIQQTQSSTQENVNQQREETLSCNKLGIDIRDGSASTVTVKQTRGDEPIGNISITWRYESKSPVQGYVNISTSRGVATSSEGNGSGTLTKLTAASLKCNSVTDEYTP